MTRCDWREPCLRETPILYSGRRSETFKGACDKATSRELNRWPGLSVARVGYVAFRSAWVQSAVRAQRPGLAGGIDQLPARRGGGGP